MTWFFAVVIVLIIGGIAVVAAGHGEGLPSAQTDSRPLGLPSSGPITAADLDRLRFNTAVHGYRMAEVDELVRRLAGQLDDRSSDL